VDLAPQLRAQVAQDARLVDDAVRAAARVRRARRAAQAAAQAAAVRDVEVAPDARAQRRGQEGLLHVVVCLRHEDLVERAKGLFSTYDVERAIHESVQSASAPEWESLPNEGLKGGSDDYAYDARDFEGTEESKDEVHSPMIYDCHRELAPPSEIEMQPVVCGPR